MSQVNKLFWMAEPLWISDWPIIDVSHLGGNPKVRASLTKKISSLLLKIVH